MKGATALILGVGNTILSDDGVGVHVAREAARLAANSAAAVDVAEAEVAGLALVDLLEGYASAIIVDAVRAPGTSPEIGRAHV